MKIEIPAPRTLCEACARQFSPLHHPKVDEHVRGLTAYCPQNCVGALFLPATGQWQIFGPIGEDAFASMMQAQFARVAQEVRP